MNRSRLVGLVLLFALGTMPAQAAIVYDHTIGGPGTGNGQFVRPAGIALDASNNLFVVDLGATAAEVGSNNVEIYDPHGVFSAVFGGGGSGNGQLTSPFAIALDATGRRYVTDGGNNRVQRFTAPGNAFDISFGSGGAGNGQFSGLEGIAVDKVTGNVYVADNGNQRIQEFTADGAFIRAWGGLGTGTGQFNRPIGVTVAGSVLYVADAFNQRVQEFDLNGNFLSSFSTGPTTEDRPKYIALDGAGNLYITLGDSHFAKFDPAGNLLENITSANGQGFDRIFGIAVDPGGSIWVSDLGHARVVAFNQPEPASVAVVACFAPVLLRRRRGS